MTLLTRKLTAVIEMSDTEPEKLTIQEAARALNVDPRTIYRLIGKGSISKVKEAGRTYVLLADVKALSGECRTCQTQDVSGVGQAEIVFDSEIDTDAAHVKAKDTHYVVDREHYEGLLIRLGQLESEKRYLLEYKEGLQEKDKALEQAKKNINAQAQELATVKSALDANSSELIEAKRIISKARLELEKIVEIKQDAERNRAALEAREKELAEIRAEVERLRLPWWKRLFLK